MPTVSYWQADPTDALAPGDPAGPFDAAIVGGGVVGAATAYALRQAQPTFRIAIVEAERLAYGASGRNAGFLLPGVHTDYSAAMAAYGRERTRRLWRFTAESIEQTAALDAAAFGLRLTGSVLAAGSPEEAHRLEAAAALMREDGVRTGWLGAEATNRRVRGEGFHGSLTLREGGGCHPARLARHLAAESGATVLEGWPVDALEPGPAGVRLAGARGRVEAGLVVLALNAYLPRLWPEADRYVRPVRAQMLATAPAPPLLGMPVYSHEGYYYIRQAADGRLLLGGARHRHAGREVGYDDATTEALQADLLRYLRRHFPTAGAPAVERRWSGTMGFSPDGLPVAGPVPDMPGAYFACGFTGHGMAYALRFGQLMARLALGEKDEAADLFRADRLASAAEPSAQRVTVSEV